MINDYIFYTNKNSMLFYDKKYQFFITYSALEDKYF